MSVPCCVVPEENREKRTKTRQSGTHLLNGIRIALAAGATLNCTCQIALRDGGRLIHHWFLSTTKITVQDQNLFGPTQNIWSFGPKVLSWDILLCSTASPWEGGAMSKGGGGDLSPGWTSLEAQTRPYLDHPSSKSAENADFIFFCLRALIFDLIRSQKDR